MPRASGDTPVKVNSTFYLIRDAPRKWGYTGREKLAPSIGIGCPAQVGIHPNLIVTELEYDRMPRASGDTPGGHSVITPPFKDAPRKWGYTVGEIYELVHTVGCPAQVGIHRTMKIQGVGIRRMPRASGDTPTTRHRFCGLSRDAPRKWGYTLYICWITRDCEGCPAQVGIHPAVKFGYYSSNRMPRASGDTPWGDRSSEPYSGDAPRKWGYTWNTPFLSCFPLGCPAQVGIHPHPKDRDPNRRRMPRASGDTPKGKLGNQDSSRGCPAQVGIHPFELSRLMAELGMPRASGDTPGFKINRTVVLWDAPRKWGYTAQMNWASIIPAGCPAQVGIHRYIRHPQYIEDRMPRASGDTPSDIKNLTAVKLDAPRKWGYTHNPCKRDG